MQQVTITVIGFGNVGQGLAELLCAMAPKLKREYQLDFRIKAIVDSRGAAISNNGINLSEVLKVKRIKGSVSSLRESGFPELTALEIIEDVESDILIEITPTSLETGEPGLTHIQKAISKGMHVITTNKGPLALALPRLLNEAKKAGVYLKFSGAVGGAMPIIDFAKRCLESDVILKIKGVLNGTTNYILWKMARERVNMYEALIEAKNLGYVEKNFRYDINGKDTACKLVILANWIMNKKIFLKDIKTKGIEDISLENLLTVEKKGLTIRLVGRIDEKEALVQPEVIPKHHPLCVSHILNSIIFTCAYSGQHILIGRGAGGRETAFSIIRDLIDIGLSLKSS